ncbi:UPF0351 protein C9orf32 [Pelomyxa schiedti]|nr:UPF0351 protein C9orf32 [Pelomyxa schiedti]
MATSSCVVCGSTTGLKTCGRCKSVFYCGPVHQKGHWSVHKLTCRPPDGSLVGTRVVARHLIFLELIRKVVPMIQTKRCGAKCLWEAMILGTPKLTVKSYANSRRVLAGRASHNEKDSRALINELIQGLCENCPPVHTQRALDCGAGIGRIAKTVLLPRFLKVDLLDQNQRLLDQAKVSIGKNSRLGDFICSGLQNFDFGTRKYDVIWVQWVIIYLNDTDFVSFLRAAKSALNTQGVIIVKDNVTQASTGQGFWVDKSDNSVIRSDNYNRWLFTQAGLNLVRVRPQPHFPKELLPVMCYVLN